MKERVIKPYVFGHSFKFGGLDLILASIHSFNVYASELPVEGSLELGISGMREITREVMGYNGSREIGNSGSREEFLISG